MAVLVVSVTLAVSSRFANVLTDNERCTEEMVMTEINEPFRQTAEQAFGTGKELGRKALDAYEQAVQNFVGAEQRAAEAAPVDWVKATIGAHASFVHELNAAYLKAAREVLT